MDKSCNIRIEAINDNARVQPDGFCFIQFLNQGASDLTINDVLTLAAGESMTFRNANDVVISTDFVVKFTAKVSNKCVVIKQYIG